MSEKITIGEIHRKLDDFISQNNESHNKIITRLDYTNGKIADVSAWRERMKGGWIVLTVIGAVLAVIVPIGISIITNKVSDEKEMKKIAEEVIGQYIEKDTK
jgi:hypothetical protein